MNAVSIIVEVLQVISQVVAEGLRRRKSNAAIRRDLAKKLAEPGGVGERFIEASRADKLAIDDFKENG